MGCTMPAMYAGTGLYKLSHATEDWRIEVTGRDRQPVRQHQNGDGLYDQGKRGHSRGSETPGDVPMQK